MSRLEGSAEAGFTLPELLVVCGVVLLLLIGAFVFIHPKNYDAAGRNAQRRLDIATLAQALNKYAAEHGPLSGLSPEPLPLTSEPGGLDLCTMLVPTYLKDLPYDPTGGAALLDGACTAEGNQYLTGYSIAGAEDGSVTLAAPAAEQSAVISLTRKY